MNSGVRTETSIFESVPCIPPMSLISPTGFILEVLRSQHTNYIEEGLAHVCFVEEKLFQMAKLKATLMIQKYR